MKGQKKSILVVDDEPDLLKLIAEHLELQGYIVDKASNGKEALISMGKSKPDLIILDEMMPEMSGFELLKAMKPKDELASIPVIMLTSRSNPNDVNTGLELNADFYLPKPFTFENLMNFVKLVLD